ncbi:MAG: hypothetical protein Q8R34_00945 [bacterium]|nr:hypothetical protein [bacterium]
MGTRLKTNCKEKADPSIGYGSAPARLSIDFTDQRGQRTGSPCYYALGNFLGNPDGR